MIKFFMKRIPMIGLSIFFASILLIIFMSDKESSKDLTIESNSFIDGLKIIQKKDGTPFWTLTARKADFKGGKNIVELSDVIMVLHRNNVILSTDKGTYDLSNQNLTTETPIRAEGKEYTITAGSIDYEASSGELTSEDRITIKGKSFTVDGKGIKVDSEQKVRILKDVKATFHNK